MTAKGVTRRAAFEAACAIAAEGRRPTIAEVRTRLGGGGQRAIMEGLDDWLLDVVRRFALPDIPAPVRELATQLWGSACAAADARWSGERTHLDARIAELQAALAEMRQAREAAAAEARHLADQLATRDGQLHETQDALDLARGEIEAGRQSLREITVALGAARAEGEEQGRRRELAEREAALARGGLQEAQGRIARLEVEQEVAAARAQLVDQALAEARGEVERGRVALAQSVALAEDLRRSVAERDAQVRTLTAAIEREQQARDEDTRHWLVRLEEQRTALAEVKERETVLVAEKRELVQEAQRLRGQVRQITAALEAARGGAGRVR